MSTTLAKIPVHTVRTSDGKWHNKMAGIVITSHRKKHAAIDKGREFAKKEKTMHRIHNEKGVIVKATNYSR